MRITCLISCLLFLLSSFYALSKPIPAVCIVPVADLISKKFSPEPGKTIKSMYQGIGQTNDSNASVPFCRITQLLYNEPVNIIQTVTSPFGDQVEIETEFWYLKQSPSGKKMIQNNRFWTLKENICTLEDLKNYTKTSKTYVPETLGKHCETTIVVLKNSWKCPKTDDLFSAGTRFVCLEKKTDGYLVTIFNAKTKKYDKAIIPKSVCLLEKKRSDTEKRKVLVELLENWAHQNPPIPYVLGGTSTGDSTTEQWPHRGMDCSGLVRRACRIVGIPVTAANSLSLLEYFKPLSVNGTPENGDLIYWKGHIVFITSTKRHLLIEARGKEFGYVHEIHFSRQLHNIRNIHDLMKAYRYTLPINRLDKKGKSYQNIKEITLLKLV